MRTRLVAVVLLAVVVSVAGVRPSAGLPSTSGGGEGRSSAPSREAPDRAAAFEALAAEAGSGGTVRVFVELAVPTVPVGDLGEVGADGQRATIEAAADDVLARLGTEGVEVRRRFGSIPFLSLEVTRAALARLRSDPSVATVAEVGTAELLGDPAPVAGAPASVEAPEAWNLGADGRGQLVAVIDDGLDSSLTAVHPDLAAKVVHEACFMTGDHCPNDEAFDDGPGAAMPCEECHHGTAVASVVAAVAPEAGLVPISVLPDGVGITWDDLAFALEYVGELETDRPVAAVNLSLGAGVTYTGPNCDGVPGWAAVEAAVANLVSKGIAVVAAAGNYGRGHGGAIDSLALPACLTDVVAVGATDIDHQVHAGYSDSSPALDLWAPGGFDEIDVSASVPDREEACPGDELTFGIPVATRWAEYPFCRVSGTSFAAPHVAGAYAVARQALAGTVAPEVDHLDLATQAFVETGDPYTDPRNNVTRPKLLVGPAIDELLSDWPARSPGSFRPSAPDRIVDTALGVGTCAGVACTAIPGNGVPVEVQVAGEGAVPPGASAVLLGVTARTSSGSGFLGVNSPGPGAFEGVLVYDDSRPSATTMVASLDEAGALEVVAAFAPADLQVDVLGWFEGDGPRLGFTPVAPIAELDEPLAEDDAVQVMVEDIGEVPAEGVDAVVVSVLVRDAEEAGTVTVATDELADPHGALTVDDGLDAAQTLVLPAADDGTITVASDVDVDLVVDVVGWFGAQEGGVYEPHVPLLAIDTEDDQVGECVPSPCGPIDGTGDVQVKVAGVGAVPEEVGAVVLQLAMTSTTPALLEVNPDDGTAAGRRPVGPDVRSMMVVAAPDENGYVTLRATGGTVEGWVMITGSFTPPGA